MDFRELVNQDNENVFFNLKEMGETLLINGEERIGILTSTNLSSKRNSGTVYSNDGTTLVLIIDKEFYEEHTIGRAMEINSDTYIIKNRSEEFGTMKFRLEQNQGY